MLRVPGKRPSSSHHEHHRELQALGAVHGHHYGAVGVRAVAVQVGVERDLVQEAGQRGVARLLYVAEDVGLQLGDVLQPGQVLVPALVAQGLLVASGLQHQVVELVHGQLRRLGAQGRHHVGKLYQPGGGAVQLLILVGAGDYVAEGSRPRARLCPVRSRWSCRRCRGRGR